MVVEYLVDPKYNLECMELKTNMLNVLEQEVLLIFIQWHAIKKLHGFLRHEIRDMHYLCLAQGLALRPPLRSLRHFPYFPP